MFSEDHGHNKDCKVAFDHANLETSKIKGTIKGRSKRKWATMQL